MATATRIRELGSSGTGAEQALWKIENGDDVHYVKSSALPLAFDTGRPETYLFAADEDGVVTDWGELPGSFRGGLDAQRAIDGYLLSLSESEEAEDLDAHLELGG